MLPQPRALSALDDQPPKPPPCELRPLNAFERPARLSCCAQELASAKWSLLNAAFLLTLTVLPLTFRLKFPLAFLLKFPLLKSLRLKLPELPYGWYPPS